MQYKRKANNYITTGVKRGYSVFKLKCSFCQKDFNFEFKLKRSSKIPCSHCKKKAYKLIYHSESKITLRKYLSKGFKKTFKDCKFRREHIVKRVYRQHEFPQMYLKNFCSTGSRIIWVYNKKNTTKQPRNIKNFSKRFFFYDQAIPQTIENMLASIEEEMAPYLSRIIESDKIFQPEESIGERQEKKELIIRFIITLYLRRKIIKKLIFNKYRNLESKEGNKINMYAMKFNSVYSNRDEQGRRIINELIQETHRKMIRATSSQEKMYKDYTINLLINRTNTPFITSDNPIIKRDGTKFKKTTIPSRIFLPISPIHCLLLAHPKKKCKSYEIEVKEEEVNKLNQWQYTYSNKYVISNLQNIEEIIKKYDITINNYPDIPLCLFRFVSNTSNRKYNFFL